MVGFKFPFSLANFRCPFLLFWEFGGVCCLVYLFTFAWTSQWGDDFLLSIQSIESGNNNFTWQSEHVSSQQDGFQLEEITKFNQEDFQITISTGKPEAAAAG